jgi:hypothetical protein|tara:strand:- start:3137 stop:3343 length:207 start_codon:yes stop_codon:yes gene_type:complete
MRIIRTVKEDSCIYILEEFADTVISTKWRPYTVGDLPNRFGCIEDGSEKGGLYEWFNYKGYTYVRDER